MRGLKRFALFVLLVVACARMAPPPGGPRRLIAPRLIGAFPDSGVAPCDFRGAAEFRFDEVTDEGTAPNFGIGIGGVGTGTLEQLVMLSPDTLIPRVEWHRDRITVRPRNGWRPNQTYRIELVAGLRDLHGNITKTSHTIAFTTCGPRPTRQLSGRVADWQSARAVPGALIEAFHLPDSARYRTFADSTGRFRMTELPAGPYLVVATMHTDRTHRRDPLKEPWDSVRVDAARDTVGEIWAFPRDTLPPKIATVTRQDSQSILVTFAKPLDPALRLDSTMVHVRVFIGSDTVSIGTQYALPKLAYDSLQKTLVVRTPKEDSLARADSVRRDSIARAAPPRPVPNVRPIAPIDSLKQKRPQIGTTLVIRTQGAVQLGQRYAITMSGVRLLDGRTGSPPINILTTQKPPTPAEIAKAKADSAKAKVKTDSIAKADSIKRATRPDTGRLIGRR
jgi:hypothetical protein